MSVFTRLNLGAGREVRAGFHSVDLNPNVDPDFVMPADALNFDDGTIEEIRAVDVLEHLPYRKTDAALAEWARVLKPGGLLYVQVPDAERIMMWFVKDKRLLLDRLPDDLPRDPLAGATWRLLGGQDDGVITQDGDEWRYNAHYSLWSCESLTLALDRAGFDVDSLEVNVHPNIMVWAVKR